MSWYLNQLGWPNCTSESTFKEAFTSLRKPICDSPHLSELFSLSTTAFQFGLIEDDFIFFRPPEVGRTLPLPLPVCSRRSMELCPSLCVCVEISLLLITSNVHVPGIKSLVVAGLHASQWSPMPAACSGQKVPSNCLRRMPNIVTCQSGPPFPFFTFFWQQIHGICEDDGMFDLTLWLLSEIQRRVLGTASISFYSFLSTWTVRPRRLQCLRRCWSPVAERNSPTLTARSYVIDPSFYVMRSCGLLFSVTKKTGPKIRLACWLFLTVRYAVYWCRQKWTIQL